MARHKIDTFYGEQYARISREQRRLGNHERKTNMIICALDAVLFRVPGCLNDQLSDLHVDGIVYTLHWRRFIASRLNEWRDFVLCTTGTLIATFTGLVYQSDGPSQCVGLIGTILAATGMLSGGMLLQKYSGMQEQHAADVIDHVQDLNHPKWGYQPTALLFSLPRAMQTWALFSLFVQIVLMVVPPEILAATYTGAAAIVLVIGTLSAVYAVSLRVWKGGGLAFQYFSRSSCAAMQNTPISLV